MPSADVFVRSTQRRRDQHALLNKVSPTRLTAGWQEARAARHSLRHSSARVSLASRAARRSAAAASSRSRACSTLMLACAALAASAVRRASRSCAADLSLSCGAMNGSQACKARVKGAWVVLHCGEHALPSICSHML